MINVFTVRSDGPVEFIHFKYAHDLILGILLRSLETQIFLLKRNLNVKTALQNFARARYLLLFRHKCAKGAFTYDVRCFWGIFDLPKSLP